MRGPSASHPGAQPERLHAREPTRGSSAPGPRSSSIRGRTTRPTFARSRARAQRRGDPAHARASGSRAGSGAPRRLDGAPIHAFRPPPGGVRLRDGDPIRVGDVTVIPIHTPGHTPDHVASGWTAREVCSPATRSSASTSLIDPPEGDLMAYLRSLRRMRDLDPRILYPGHGPVVLGQCENWRSISPIEASGSGRSSTPSPALPARSPRSSTWSTCGLPSERPLASRSVLAHLKKLEGEGRVEHTGRGRSMRYFIADPRACERCGRRVGVVEPVR